jgi:hypothetical protein
MNADRVDEKFAEVLEKAQPPLGGGWQERALKAMAASAPRRARSRVRLVAVAVGVLAALSGLGFVPFPAGSAKGAWNRALAAAAQATTVYMRGREWTDRGEFDFQEWLSEDGFCRHERLQGGSIKEVTIRGGEGERRVRYDAERGRATDVDMPPWRPGLPDPPVLPTKDLMLGLFKSFQFFKAEGFPVGDVKMAERREWTLWSGARDVVEVQAGDLARARAEIEPDSGHILSLERFRNEGWGWALTYRLDYIEWGVEIPENVKDFDPPPGTTVTRVRWWTGRADKVIATATTADWEVTLHAIDVNRRGDLYLTLSRMPSAEKRGSWYNGGLAIKVDAVDDSGAVYKQQNGYGCARDYWSTILERGASSNPDAIPRRVTFTMYPYRRGLSKDQSVTFRDVRLPARQSGDDLGREAREVVQY